MDQKEARRQVEAFCPDFGAPFRTNRNFDANDDSQGLDANGVLGLQQKFQECGLKIEAASFLAGRLPCEYLAGLEQAKAHLRPSQMSEELGAIQDAASALARALKASSGETLNRLADALRDEQAEILIEDASPLYITGRMFPRNRETLFALLDLAGSAKALRASLPVDSGGQVAGDHDQTGASVRKALTLRLRRGFKRLGLKAGSQADGPIASVLRLIHEAATGVVESTWGKRYAEMAPGLERANPEPLEDDYLEWESYIFDPDRYYQAERKRRLEMYRTEVVDTQKTAR